MSRVREGSAGNARYTAGMDRMPRSGGLETRKVPCIAPPRRSFHDGGKNLVRFTNDAPHGAVAAIHEILTDGTLEECKERSVEIIGIHKYDRTSVQGKAFQCDHLG